MYFFDFKEDEMPRKSAAELSLVAIRQAPERPKPPDELTEVQATEWRAVVARMPWDWFPRETQGLLVQHCRHVVRARALAEQINTINPAELEGEKMLTRYDRLLRMAERESRAITALGRAMRITQRSRVRAETAGTAAQDPGGGRKPWDP
jgi:hypothetical protein